MTATLKVEIDIKSVSALLDALPPSAFQNAWRRALRKTVVWIKSQVAREISKATGISQKVLRQRLYFFLRSRDAGKVWLGLNAIEASRLGAPRQTRTGITAGRFRFPGAWTMKNRDPQGTVYQRTGNARLPYEVVKVDWSGPGEAAFRRAAEKAQARLLEILRQEVNYELQKAMAR